MKMLKEKYNIQESFKQFKNLYIVYLNIQTSNYIPNLYHSFILLQFLHKLIFFNKFMEKVMGKRHTNNVIQEADSCTN